MNFLKSALRVLTLLEGSELAAPASARPLRPEATQEHRRSRGAGFVSVPDAGLKCSRDGQVETRSTSREYAAQRTYSRARPAGPFAGALEMPRKNSPGPAEIGRRFAVSPPPRSETIRTREGPTPDASRGQDDLAPGRPPPLSQIVPALYRCALRSGPPRLAAPLHPPAEGPLFRPLRAPAPISTNLILSHVATHVLDLPKSF